MGMSKSVREAQHTPLTSQVFNIYCDESCHLENDGHSVMVLGALWCTIEETRNSAIRIREIKEKHGIRPDFEVKWTKVSPAQESFYLDLVDYFFDDDDLHFRALIVPDKSKLRHEDFYQSHDTWYYKMYFDMLKVILEPKARHRIYLDIKDTRSAPKVAELHKVLSNNMYDFSQDIIERVQTVRSHEVELLQLADLLIGAVSYANRGLAKSEAKTKLVARMRKRSHYSLNYTTLLKERKVNLFRWHASESQA
jgi:hypothetical protein